MNQKKYSEKSFSIFQIQRIPRAICRGPGMFRLSNRPPCVCAGPVWRAVTDQWTSTPLVTRKVIILWRVWKICLVSAFSLPPPKKSPLRDSDNYLTVYWSSIFDIVLPLFMKICLWFEHILLYKKYKWLGYTSLVRFSLWSYRKCSYAIHYKLQEDHTPTVFWKWWINITIKTCPYH